MSDDATSVGTERAARRMDRFAERPGAAERVAAIREQMHEADRHHASDPGNIGESTSSED